MFTYYHITREEIWEKHFTNEFTILFYPELYSKACDWPWDHEIKQPCWFILSAIKYILLPMWGWGGNHNHAWIEFYKSTSKMWLISLVETYLWCYSNLWALLQSVFLVSINWLQVLYKKYLKKGGKKKCIIAFTVTWHCCSITLQVMEAKDNLVWLGGNLKKRVDLKPMQNVKISSARWWPPDGSVSQGIGGRGLSASELPEI